MVVVTSMEAKGTEKTDLVEEKNNDLVFSLRYSRAIKFM